MLFVFLSVGCFRSDSQRRQRLVNRIVKSEAKQRQQQQQQQQQKADQWASQLIIDFKSTKLKSNFCFCF